MLKFVEELTRIRLTFMTHCVINVMTQCVTNGSIRFITLEVSSMNIFKKAFLFVVGAVAIAMEEAEKAIKEQQKKREQAAHKVEA